jgi:hypothetical protein
MNVGFEVLVCDIDAANLREVYSVNATLPGQWKNDQNKLLPRDSNRSPPHGYGTWYSEQLVWEWLRSATTLYGGGEFAGNMERRVQLNMCGIVTFYDPSLPSLTRGCRSTEASQCSLGSPGLRSGHRLLNISLNDAEWIQTCIREATSDFLHQWRCTGIDWQLLTERITAYHKPRLLQAIWVSESYFGGTISLNRASRMLHEIFHALMYPYLEASELNSRDDTVSEAMTLERCVMGWTGEIGYRRLNRLEKIVWSAIAIVLHNLCQHEWAMLRFFTDPSSQPHFDTILRDIQQRTANVTSWLGWDRPTRCEQRCESDEICYIPMWPLIYSPGHGQGGIFAGELLTDEELVEFWRPKCISRFDYDRGGGKGRDPWHQNARVDDVPYEAEA